MCVSNRALSNFSFVCRNKSPLAIQGTARKKRVRKLWCPPDNPTPVYMSRIQERIFFTFIPLHYINMEAEVEDLKSLPGKFNGNLLFLLSFPPIPSPPPLPYPFTFYCSRQVQICNLSPSLSVCLSFFPSATYLSLTHSHTLTPTAQLCYSLWPVV